MSNNILDFQASETNTNITSSLLKLLVFEMGILTLALPVEQVQKVIKRTDVHGSGLSYVNLSHLGEQEIAIVDLHRKLFRVSQTDNSSNSGYFIITKNIIGEPLGIAIAQTPTLIDIPLSQVRTLPDSYRRADTLEIASHVAVISRENGTSLTVFILDLEQLI